MQMLTFCSSVPADYLAGFGYSFLNHPLQDFDEFSGNASDLNQPLVNHPGGGFQYGVCFSSLCARHGLHSG